MTISLNVTEASNAYINSICVNHTCIFPSDNTTNTDTLFPTSDPQDVPTTFAPQFAGNSSDASPEEDTSPLNGVFYTVGGKKKFFPIYSFDLKSFRPRTRVKLEPRYSLFVVSHLLCAVELETTW